VIRRLLLVVVASAVLSAVVTVRASDLPPNYQALFLLRVLAYDRNLKNRAHDAVNVVVVYRDGDDASVAMKSDISGAFEKISDAKVAGLPFHVTSVAFASPPALESVLGSSKAAAVYVCPGLDPVAITDMTRKHSVLTFTGIEPFVKAGVSIGLVARAGKPAIIVNLNASKAEGADLDPALLRLAELVR
jgi:YfiR/HmsC-like